MMTEFTVEEIFFFFYKTFSAQSVNKQQSNSYHTSTVTNRGILLTSGHIYNWHETDPTVYQLETTPSLFMILDSCGPFY